MGGALYQYTLQGENLAELNLWASRMLAQMRGLKELTDVNSDQMDKGLQVSVVFDRDTAARFNIRSALVDEALYDAFGQRQVSINYTLLNQYHVVMEVEPRFWQHPETLQDIYVTPPTGAAVPLSAFARFERTSTSLAVNHQSQFPASTISFNLAPSVALGDAVRTIEKAQQQMGMPAGIRGSFQGTAKAFQASLANQPLLILAALVAVYIVLGILYESYIHPITILSTLPSAGVGAVLALLIFGLELSVIAIIGVILLIGLVKKNGIMMVDFALESERKEGKSPMEAIYQACLLRFRPIMMTTMAAMLGALPLALGTGVGSELRRPLGISIIGGLIFSQMLTLYTTPVIYLYMDRFRIRLARKRQEHKAHRFPLLVIGLFVLSVFLLASCSIGPKYTRPKAPVPLEFKEAAGWKAAQPQDHLVRGKWWEAFNDPELNALEEQAATASLSIVLAEAQYRQALELVRAARSGYFPVVSAAAQYNRGSTSYNATSLTQGTVTSVYSLPLTASWELDIWGRVRKQVEAQKAGAEASAADLESVRLSVQAGLAQAYFQMRALDGQKQLLDQTIEGYRKSLELTQNRYKSGVASRADVLQADTQLKTVQAQAIDLGVQRSQLEHAIALLCGKAPAVFSLPFRQLTAQVPGIPAGIPSELLERRPDIASAERRVAAANAQIGVAITAYFPTLSLGATVGLESTQIGNLISWPSRFWSLGPSLSEIIFSGGLRRAQTAQAWAVYDQTVAQYRQTVLTGFQEVEDNLAALRILAEEAAAQNEVVLAARQTLAVVTNQYKSGIVSYLNVVTAQTTVLSNEITALDILNRRMNAGVLLIKALGGGWDASLLNSAQADERVKK
jgi:NodT family efflux transporter outer membrane factor (OMF) lipoprotein